MFADNHRISRRQLSRQLLVGLSGVFLLTIPQIPEMRGWSGILGMILGVAVLWIYLFFLVRKTAVARSLKERLSKPVYVTAVIFYLSYLVLSGGYLVRLSSEMITTSLLTEYPAWVIGLLLIVTAFAGTGNEIQRRARIGEVSCLPVVGCLFLLVILAGFQIRDPGLHLWEAPSISQVLKGAYHVFCAFSIVGILPFLMHQVERPQGAVRYLFAGTGAAALLAAGSLVVVQMLFGVQGSGAKKIPLTALMSAVNFPGDFLDRFDALWMVFLIFALLYSLGTILFYGRHLAGERDIGWIGFLLAGAIFLTAFSSWKGNTVFTIYPFGVRYVYMPVFVIFGLSLSKVRRKA